MITGRGHTIIIIDDPHDPRDFGTAELLGAHEARKAAAMAWWNEQFAQGDVDTRSISYRVTEAELKGVT